MSALFPQNISSLLSSNGWSADISGSGFEAQFARKDSSLLVSCEHASNAVLNAETTEQDRAILESHWGWDKGAAIVAKEISNHFGCFSIPRGLLLSLVDVLFPDDARQ